MSIETLIAQYGIPGLFLGAIVEGETVLMLGGLMAHRGLMDLGAAVAAGAAGSFLSDQAFFYIGRHFRDHPRIRRLMARPAFAHAVAVFDRHPLPFAFGFRFLYGMRTVSPLAIGTTGFSPARFLAVNAAAAVVWAACFVLIGYAFGQGVETMMGRRLRLIEHLAIATLAFGLIVTVLHRLVRRHLRHSGRGRPRPDADQNGLSGK